MSDASASRSTVRRQRYLVSLLTLLAASLVLSGQVPRRRRGCPRNSVLIEGTFCVDRYEGSLVEVLPRGRTRPWDPHTTPANGGHYRAVSRRGVVPQGYISQVQARAACASAGKRLCTEEEWTRACRGPTSTTYPYGERYERGRCNDQGVSPLRRLFGGGDVFRFRNMNDPRLNAIPGTLARTGQFSRCKSRWNVQDMVGNLHEWVATVHRGRGVFRGGYYLDVHINGDGCGYATRAHGLSYHDYSTGFRCCSDPR